MGRIPGDKVLPVLGLAVLAVIMLIAYPWEFLTIVSIAYLALIPVSLRSYRRHAAADGRAASPEIRQSPEAGRPHARAPAMSLETAGTRDRFEDGRHRPGSRHGHNARAATPAICLPANKHRARLRRRHEPHPGAGRVLHGAIRIAGVCPPVVLEGDAAGSAACFGIGQGGRVTFAKVAVTDLAVSIVTEQVLLPSQSPDQPVKTEPEFGMAVSVRVVPKAKLRVQFSAQLSAFREGCNFQGAVTRSRLGEGGPFRQSSRKSPSPIWRRPWSRNRYLHHCRRQTSR